MMKANGRIKKESANSKKTNNKNKGKQFVCVECGAAEDIDVVEFGEVVECGICGNKMVEA